MENYWYDNSLSLTTKLMINLKIKCEKVIDWDYESIEHFNLGKSYQNSFDYKLYILFRAGAGDGGDD